MSMRVQAVVIRLLVFQVTPNLKQAFNGIPKEGLYTTRDFWQQITDQLSCQKNNIRGKNILEKRTNTSIRTLERCTSATYQGLES